MIVLGLGFGDEGKGLVTSYLCSKVTRPIVVRFNGGHQAGHTVIHKNRRHVFSSFGSGTLQGVPTYWSKHCTVYPIALVNEYTELLQLLPEGPKPILILDPLCPITTPYDVAFNQRTAKHTGHGSVGVGFGTTLQRHQDNYKLFAQDLLHPVILKIKLEQIRKYYKELNVEIEDALLNHFLNDCRIVAEITRIDDSGILLSFNPIFEGAQGILLDQDHGFFPHVTRSYTTSRNAQELRAKNDIFYVTRSYQTRHGAGPMTKESIPVQLTNHENETNKEDEFQGTFRVAPLDPNLIRYAIQCDQNYRNKAARLNLVITCMDQHPIDVKELIQETGLFFHQVYLSHGPSLDDISLLTHQNR
jgi:adenylosuccinate synthase